jgi:NRAMP (natural resistance-associated macrophage protein)-like metal ion transporter
MSMNGARLPSQSAPVPSPQTEIQEQPVPASGDIPLSKNFLKTLISKLGPGLVTGASDDDPSGIGTYSQIGAQFGYGMLWTMVVSYPLMSAFQEICARIGRVTGHGIANNVRLRYPRLLYGIVGLVVLANIFNLGADIQAMGAAVRLLLPGPAVFYGALLAGISVLAQLLVPYSKYVHYLKWLTLLFLSYLAAAFFVHISWGDALANTFAPRISFRKPYFLALIAVLGTTISPYLFFWQASQEAEEVKTKRGEKALRRAPRQAFAQFSRIRTDTYLGMAFSNLIAFFIILTTAATLHASGETDIGTAAQAAKALEPLAGRGASFLFSTGIIGTGLLAVPVLAGSAAYGLGEALRWDVSLERKPGDAKKFYGAIAACTTLGLLLNFASLDPMKALFWAAVLNGLAAVPLMFVIMIMASSRQVMGTFVLPTYLKVVGWLAAIVMSMVCAGLVLTWHS